MKTDLQCDLFWHDYYKHSDLDRLRGVLAELPLHDLAEQVRRRRNGSGRRDWPAESMIASFFAIKVLGHESVESFRRELRRNPSLMLALGLKLKGVWVDDPTDCRCPGAGGELLHAP